MLSINDICGFFALFVKLGNDIVVPKGYTGSSLWRHYSSHHLYMVNGHFQSLHMIIMNIVDCFVAIFMIDVLLYLVTGWQLRCTYRAYDAVDEITAAFSVAFNPTGTK